MQKSFLPLIFSLCTLYSAVSAADDLTLTGTQTVALHTDTRTALRAFPPKTLTLLAFKLSPTAQTYLYQRQDVAAFTPPHEATAVQHSKQLNMNGVPVLDQGVHGTCATFAATAAVEATIKQPNTISQLCQLQLGNYLARTSYHPSGWDGTLGYIALHQIDAFGIITKTQQAITGCGGLTEYPASDPATPTSEITPEAFHRMSTEVPFLWYPILHVNESFSKPINPAKILSQVKEAINHHDRVVFGTLLVDVDTGTVGALGHHHTKQDTWIVTPKIRHDIEQGAEFAGHEMVITGYDDDATATDNTGTIHRGLLTLRNSWGAAAGDQGNFYMSYEYFMNMVIEAYGLHMPDTTPATA